MTRKNTLRMVECAILLGLAFALSFVVIYEMPMGGAVTLASMLPIMLISIKYGTKTGVSCAFVYSLLQLFQAVIKGNVFIYCSTGALVAICALFDYVVPFTVLGFAGTLKKNGNLGLYIGMTLSVLFRFACHFMTGVFIWGQWAPEGMGPYLYSFFYNGGFLSLDFIICILVAIPLLQIKQIRKLLSIN